MVGPVLRKLARDQWVRLHGTPRVTVLVGDAVAREIWARWIAVTGTPGVLVEGAFDDAIRSAVARAVAAPAQPVGVVVSAAEAARWRAGRQDRLAAMVDEGWAEVGGAGCEVTTGATGAAAGEATANATGAATAKATGEATANATGETAANATGAATATATATANATGAATANATGETAANATGAATANATAEGEGESEGGPAHRASHVDARSVAEATLFEALEATPATAGRFALNESLSVRFGGQAAEVDLLSRRDRVAIEIDGFHHFADLEGYRRDRKKDVLLQGQGLFVVRVLAEDVMRDPRAAVNTVCQALAYRLKEPG